MKNNYLYHTNYFNQPRTWVIRIFEAFVVVFLILWVDVQEVQASPQLLGVGYLFAGALAAYVLLRPVDELALDNDKLYYLQRSAIPFFNRGKAYDISNVKNIKSAIAITPILPVYSLLPGKLSRSKIEITSKSGRLERRHLTIDKQELDKIVSKIDAMME
ncbi:MAG: hypothetical protein AAF632_10230 [Bacteroidota bacterium]